MSVVNAAIGNVVQTVTGASPAVGAAQGNRIYYRGLPLMLRNNKRATTISKANRAMLAVPRHKFMFYACFTPGVGARGANFQSWQTGFAFQINRVDRVKASPKTQTLNQYNRKRSVHTGIDYPDLSLTLHDTVDDRVLRVWRDYHKWYFGDGRPKNAATTWRSSVIRAREDFPVSNGWGFAPSAGVNGNTNFFDTLDVYTFYGKKYTQVTFYNPKIESITFDAMDASATSELSTVEMSIKHEGFAFTQVAAPVTSREVQLFGLNLGDYFEPADAFGGVNAFLLDLNDQIESTLDNLLGGVSQIPFVGGVLAGLGSNAIRASGVTGILPRAARTVSGTTLSRWGTFR
jgi:hypothetical protein